jgi:hypothetical protein
MSKLGATDVIEVRYLSMNNTHIQVEYIDQFGFEEEFWLPLSEVEPDFNVMHDIMELTVSVKALREVGIL